MRSGTELSQFLRVFLSTPSFWPFHFMFYMHCTCILICTINIFQPYSVRTFSPPFISYLLHVDLKAIGALV